MMSKSDLTPEEQATIRNSKDPSVIMTANGTRLIPQKKQHTFSLILTCLLKFNQVWYSGWENCAKKTVLRVNDIQVSHHICCYVVSGHKKRRGRVVASGQFLKKRLPGRVDTSGTKTTIKTGKIVEM